MNAKEKENIIQVIKFVLFSASAGLIQILSFTLLNELVNWGERFVDAKYGPNYFISLFLSVLWNFTFNRKFTFKSANNIPIAMLKVLAYYCVFTPLSIWWGIELTGAVTWKGFEYVVLVGTMLINMATEYLVCKFWVYRNSENTNTLAHTNQGQAVTEYCAPQAAENDETIDEVQSTDSTVEMVANAIDDEANNSTEDVSQAVKCESNASNEEEE